jgi:hypothetical protein
MTKKKKEEEPVQDSVDLTTLSQEELIAKVEELTKANTELEKDLANQKKYAAGLNKQLKDKPAVTGPVKSHDF